MKKTTQKNNKFKLIISAIVSFILLGLAVLCIIYKIKLSYILGIISLLVTFLISMYTKVSKETCDKLSMISAVLDIISIPLMILFGIIFSYILTVPAFILSLRNHKVAKTKLTFIILIVSLLLFGTCIGFSITGVIQVLKAIN